MDKSVVIWICYLLLLESFQSLDLKGQHTCKKKLLQRFWIVQGKGDNLFLVYASKGHCLSFICSDFNFACCENCAIAATTTVCEAESKLSCMNRTFCEYPCPFRALSKYYLLVISFCLCLYVYAWVHMCVSEHAHGNCKWERKLRWGWGGGADFLLKSLTGITVGNIWLAPKQLLLKMVQSALEGNLSFSNIRLLDEVSYYLLLYLWYCICASSWKSSM